MAIGHYVPQFYLQFFSVYNNEEKINLFDKRKREVRKMQSIRKLAAENEFYCIDWEDELVKRNYEFIGEKYSYKDDCLEKYFADKIEAQYSSFFRNIINRINHNNYFLSKEDKIIFVKYILIQAVRTKEALTEKMQIFSEMSRVLKKLTMKSGATENIKHFILETEMMKDNKSIMNLLLLEMIDGVLSDEELINKMVDYHFVIAINRTEERLITSDNPILKIPHISDPYINMSGFNSKGVEIIFPLTPTTLIILYENEHHKNMKRKQVLSKDDVKNYNFLQFFNSYCYSFSGINNFNFAEEFCKNITNDMDLLDYQRIFSNH